MEPYSVSFIISVQFHPLDARSISKTNQFTIRETHVSTRKRFSFNLDCFLELYVRLDKIKAEEGVFTKERIDSLLNKKWHIYSMILHEITYFDKMNSTLRSLSDLPEKVFIRKIKIQLKLSCFFFKFKEKVFLLNDHPLESEFHDLKILSKFLKAQKNQTFEIKVKPPKSFDYLKKIEILSSIEVFESVSLRNAKDLLHSVKEEHYAPGELVIFFFLIIILRIFSC